MLYVSELNSLIINGLNLAFPIEKDLKTQMCSKIFSYIFY